MPQLSIQAILGLTQRVITAFHLTLRSRYHPLLTIINSVQTLNRPGRNLNWLAGYLCLQTIYSGVRQSQIRRRVLGKSSQTFTPQKWEPSVQMGVVMPARRWQGGPM